MTTAYTDTYAKEYSPDNLYSYGQKGFSEPVATFSRPALDTQQPRGLTNLIGSGGEAMANQQAYSSLSDPYKFILEKKWGLWKGTDQDTGQKGVADTLDDINKIVVYKGGKPVSNWSQVPGALDPIIAKRNKKGGLGGIMGLVAPIALSFLAPGIGTALGAGLGISATAGSALAGAGLGGLGGLISGGGAKGALLGAALGGAGGAFSGAGGLSGLTKAAGKVGASGSVSPFFSPLSKASRFLGSGSSGLTNVSSLAKLASGLEGVTSNSQSSYSSDDQAQLAALIQQLQQQGGGQRRSAFLQAAGMARGGIVRGPGDGMSDGVPAIIGGGTPAALSDGEHVVPALQVAMLGRGSSKAGSARIKNLVQQEINKLYGESVDPVKLQKTAMRGK